jgi:hypothetical protein
MTMSITRTIGNVAPNAERRPDAGKLMDDDSPVASTFKFSAYLPMEVKNWKKKSINFWRNEPQLENCVQELS